MIAGARAGACLAATLLVAALAGCAAGSTQGGMDTTAATPQASGATTSAPAKAAPQPTTLAPRPVPGPTAGCPYLTNREAADLNGQLVSTVRLDTTFDPPACFFVIGNRSVQLSVWVFRASSAAQAAAVVDRAAPIDTADPASAPAGWMGGRSGGPTGAVYAVAKGAVAVVVTTNQEQSIKAQRVAERVIGTLAL